MSISNNPHRPPNPNPQARAWRDVPTSLTTSKLAIWALVLSIPGLSFAPLGVAAMIMGIIAVTQISNPARALTGHGMAITGIVLGGLSIVVTPMLVMIAVMLPALSAARQAATAFKNTSQVRGVVQGMMVYGGGNNDYYPGLDSNGNPVDLTVEGRFKEMLDNNLFGGNDIISSSETKTVWQGGVVTTANYAYALPDVSDPGGRCDEWSVTNNGMAIIVSDRNTGASPAPSDVSSIHTQSPGMWIGDVGRNDGSAAFEPTHELDVQYGRDPTYQFDNIFDMSARDDAAMIEAGD